MKSTTYTTPDGRTVTVHQPGIPRQRHDEHGWRLNESAYRRFEPALELAVTRYEQDPPQETCFDVPAGMTFNTFVARLRDARQALLTFGYNPTLQQRMAALRNETCIAGDAATGKVWFRSRRPVGRPVKVTAVSAGVIPGPQKARLSTPVAYPAPDELDSMCHLIHAGRLSGPFVFVGRGDPSVHEALELKYDVAFTFDEAQNTTTLL